MPAESNTANSRLSRLSNQYLPVILIILGICGLLVCAGSYRSVFPSASINFAVPKSDILQLAEDWTKKLGYQKQNIIKSITFDLNESTKTFLEYELGNETANELMKDQIPVFYWHCSFKHQLDQQKMDINISPQGKLFCFDHNLPNDRIIKTIDHDKAMSKALAFVLQQTGWSVGDCKLVEDKTTKQLHRIDYDFSWEYQKLDWHSAKLRANVKISGNLLSGFNKFLQLPETWQCRYRAMRSFNDLLQTLAEIFYFPLYIAAIFICFRSVSSKNIRWRFTIFCSITLTAIYAIESLNQIQSKISNYNPEQEFSAFLCTTYLCIALTIPFIFVLIAVVAAATERIYSLTFPSHLPIDKWFNTTGLRSHYVLFGLLIGFAAFGISIGYQICYYLLGRQFHFWCPLGIDNCQTFTASFPWFSSLSSSIFASASEECLYRVLALSLAQRFLKKFWLANVLQAVAWGFMHSNYPQQPACVRGIEISIEGIFLGWIVRRYGLLPCLVSHYLFDVLWTAIPLLSAPLLNLKLSAFIPLSPLLVISLIGLWLRCTKGVPREDSLTIPNQAGKLSPETKMPQMTDEFLNDHSMTENFEYQPLTRPARLILVAASSILLITSFFWHQPNYQIYQEPVPLLINKQEANNIARNYLLSNKFDLTDYLSSVTVSDGLASHKQELQYIYEKMGFKQADTIAHQTEDPHIWDVRYFKPGSIEEYRVYLDHLGNICSQKIIRAENIAGANLTQNQAKIIALDFLHRYRHIYEPLVLYNTAVNHHMHRTDYSFEFKSSKYKVSDANLIVSIDIVGDIPSNANHYWKLPDKWKWERTKSLELKPLPNAIANIVVGIFLITFLFGMVILFIACPLVFVWWLLSLFTANYVHWRVALVPSVVFSVIICLILINLIPSCLHSCSTTISLLTFATTFIAIGFIMISIATALMFFALGIAWAAIKQLGFTERTLTALKCFAPALTSKKAEVQFNILLDAILLASTYALFGNLFSGIASPFGSSISHTVILNNFSLLDMVVNCYSPAIAEIAVLACSLLCSTVILLISTGMLTWSGINTGWRILIFAILANAALELLAIGSQHTFYWQEHLFHFIYGTCILLLFCIFLRIAVQRNALSLVIWLFINSIFSSLLIFTEWGYPLKPFLQCGWPLFRLDIMVISLTILSPLAYLIYLKICARSIVSS